MTQRKSKKIPQPNSAIACTAPVEAVEDVKQESNTKVASKPKQAKTTAKKASTGGRRGRPKKALVEKVGDDIVYTEAGKKLLDETLTTVSKAIDVDSRTITYVDPMTMAAKQEPKPSSYDRFKDWVVGKIYYYTSFFRGY